MSLILAHKILTEPLLIRETDQVPLSLYAVGQIKGENKNEPPYKPNEQPYAMAVGAGGKTALDKAPTGAIAVIPIQGVMMKNDISSWSGIVYPGSTTIGQWIQQADSDPNIIGIILDIDSPGGMASAGEELNAIVSSTKKPVVSVFGLMASAAYYAGAASNQIFAKAPSSSVGSIGTMCSFYDFSGMLAEYGIVQHEIYATASVDKNKDYRDAKAGNYEGMIKNGLDPINDMFMAAVDAGRAGKIDDSKENVKTGKVYYTKQAKKNGLIDGDGGMAAAVKFISKQNNNNQKNTNMSLKIKKESAVATTLGWKDDVEAKEGGVFIQESEIPALESALAAGATAATDVTRLTAELATANTNYSNLQAISANQTKANADLTTKVTGLEAQVKELGGESSGNGTVTTAAGDPIVAKNEKVPSYLAADNPANILADQAMSKKKTDWKKMMAD